MEAGRFWGLTGWFFGVEKVVFKWKCREMRGGEQRKVDDDRRFAGDFRVGDVGGIGSGAV